MPASFGSNSKNQSKQLDKTLNGMPDTVDVAWNEKNSTAGRLESMLKSNSPLMKLAATQGKQLAQGRGLLNSSMGVGAAQGAMISAATPIAQQDASALNSNAQQNAAAENNMAMQKAGLISNDYLQNLQTANQADLNQQGFGFQKDMANLNAKLTSQRDAKLAQYDKEAARLQAELSEARAKNDFSREKQLTEQQAKLQRQRDNLLSDLSIEELGATSAANAWGVMANNVTDIVAQAMEGIANIQANANIKSEDKTKMIEQLKKMRDSDISFQKNLYTQLSGFLKNTGLFPNL